jgi:nitrile hydratase beta subunit
MTRIHDMGGRFGDGPVVPEPEGEVFREGWHARALAVTLAAGALGKWNIDMSRFSRESLAPRDYATFSYYEKWMAGLADLLVETGVVTRDELAAGQGAPSDLATRCLAAADVAPVMARGNPSAREIADAPRFAPGDSVRTVLPAGNRRVPGGHTRLPAYAAGQAGRVLHHHGAHVLPDASAHGQTDVAEHLYAVVIPAASLWIQAEGAGDEVVLDLWESYLEPGQ